MIDLNHRDPRPIFLQLKDALRQQILAGALAEGEQLPSVRETAMSLAINPNTIQRAYRELEAEGWLQTIPGKGSFVRQSAEARQAEQCAALERLDRELVRLRQAGYSREDLMTHIGSVWREETL